MRRLLGAELQGALTVAQVIESFGLDGRPSSERQGGPAASAQGGAPPRPRVLINMASTVDGRASVEGRSAPISNRADRELFHGLRAAVDAVIVGAGTARAERYRRMIREQAPRRRRIDLGLSEEPLACIVSKSLSLSALDVPLLGEQDAHVVIVTDSQASLPAEGLKAQVQYIRASRENRLDLRAALGELHERFGVHTLLCEGGPRLASTLLADGLGDELLLCFGAKLAGGAASERRILDGPQLEPPLELELLDVLEYESNLFLRYGAASSAT